MASGINI